MKQPNLSTDGLTIQKAAELLRISKAAVGFAVSQGHLRCGIMARSWRGKCLPKFKGAKWVCGHTSDQTLSCTDRNSGKTFKVREIFASQFWYLHHTPTYELFTISQDGKAAIPLLEPYDGVAAHKEDPAAFPTEDVDFWPFQPDTDSISIDNILFLKRDIEKYGVEYLSSALIDGPVPDYLNKSHPCYSSKLAEAIECWIALFGEKATTRHNAGYTKQIEEWLKDHVSKAPSVLTPVISPDARGTDRDQAKKMEEWNKINVLDVKE